MGLVTLHRETLNRATVRLRQFTGRQLTGATIITAATDIYEHYYGRPM